MVLVMTNDVLTATMSGDEACTSLLEKRRLKRSRQCTSSSQSNEDVISEDCSHHGGLLCNTKLQQIEEKLDEVQY